MAQFSPEFSKITNIGMQMISDVTSGGRVFITDVVSTNKSASSVDELLAIEHVNEEDIKSHLDILARSTVGTVTKFELALTNSGVTIPYNLHQIIIMGYSTDEEGNNLRGSKTNPVAFYIAQTETAGYDPIPPAAMAVTVYYTIFISHSNDLVIEINPSDKSYNLVSPMLNDLVATLDANGDLANPLPDNGIIPGTYNQFIVNKKGLIVWAELKKFLDRDDLKHKVDEFERVVQLEHGDEFMAVDKITYDDIGSLVTINTTRYVLPGEEISADYNNPYIVGLRIDDVRDTGNYEIDYPVVRQSTLREVSYWQDYTATADTWSVLVPFQVLVNKTETGGSISEFTVSPKYGYRKISDWKVALKNPQIDEDTRGATFDIESIPMYEYEVLIRRTGTGFKVNDEIILKPSGVVMKVKVISVNSSGAITGFRVSPRSGVEILSETLIDQYSTSGSGSGSAFSIISTPNHLYRYDVSIRDIGQGYVVGEMLTDRQYDDYIIDWVTVKDMIQSKRVIPSRRIYPGTTLRFSLRHTENRPPESPDLSYNPPPHPDSKGVVAWVYDGGSGYSADDKTYVDLTFYDPDNRSLEFETLDVINGHLKVGSHPGTPFKVEGDGKFPITPFYRSLINDGGSSGLTSIPMGDGADKGSKTLTQHGTSALICMTPLMYYKVLVTLSNPGSQYNVDDKLEVKFTDNYNIIIIVTEVGVSGEILEYTIDKDQWTTTGDEESHSFYYTVNQSLSSQESYALTGIGSGATFSTSTEEVPPVPVLPRQRVTHTAIDYSFTNEEEADLS